MMGHKLQLPAEEPFWSSSQLAWWGCSHSRPFPPQNRQRDQLPAVNDGKDHRGSQKEESQRNQAHDGTTESLRCCKMKRLRCTVVDGLDGSAERPGFSAPLESIT